jgi:hypothetical protein
MTVSVSESLTRSAECVRWCLGVWTLEWQDTQVTGSPRSELPAGAFE